MAQDAAGVPQAIIATSSPLTGDQKERIKTFVEAQIALVARGDGEKATRARNELATLPGRPGVSEIFQREYAALVRPALDPILTGDDPQRAVNAVIIGGSLRSPESVDLLLQFSDPEREKRAPVRLRAASSLPDAIANAGLTPVQLDGAVRRIVAAAAREQEWVALHHAFRALVRVAGMPRLPDDSVASAIRGQGELLTNLVERIAKEPGPSQLMIALANNLNLVVREELPTIRADRARLLRARLATMLVKLLRTIDTQWEAVQQAGGDAAKPYASAVSVAELLLKVAATSDAQQQLEVSFAKHWDGNDRAAFAADLKKADAVVAKLAAAAPAAGG